MNINRLLDEDYIDDDKMAILKPYLIDELGKVAIMEKIKLGPHQQAAEAALNICENKKSKIDTTFTTLEVKMILILSILHYENMIFSGDLLLELKMICLLKINPALDQTKDTDNRKKTFIRYDELMLRPMNLLYDHLLALRGSL